MHELLIKVAGMWLKIDFSTKVFVLRSMGNKLVPSHLKGEDPPILLRERIHDLLTTNKYTCICKTVSLSIILHHCLAFHGKKNVCRTTDVSKMHSNEAIPYYFYTGKDELLTTTRICSILWQVHYNCTLRIDRSHDFKFVFNIGLHN